MAEVIENFEIKNNNILFSVPSLLADPKTTFGIYGIRNKITKKIYIGSTTQTFHLRWSCHIHSLNNGSHDNEYLKNSWKTHGKDAFEFFIIEIFDEINDVISAEDNWLDKFKNEDKLKFNRDISYNIRLLASGMKHSDETIEKIRKASVGRIKSEETRKKLSEANKGENNAMYGKFLEDNPFYQVAHSDETREKLRQINLASENKERKAVNQFDLNGILINTFISVGEAERQTDIHGPRISNCCNGITKSAGGYIWSFVNPEHKIVIRKKIGPIVIRKVIKYDKNGNMLGIFNNLSEASKNIGVDRNTIKKCCKGLTKSAGGFVWKFMEENNDK